MERITQKKMIINYLELLGCWIPAYNLRGRQTKFGFLGHQADRRARELANEGKIERKLKGKFAYYKAIGEEKNGIHN